MGRYKAGLLCTLSMVHGRYSDACGVVSQAGLGVQLLARAARYANRLRHAAWRGLQGQRINLQAEGGQHVGSRFTGRAGVDDMRRHHGCVHAGQPATRHPRR